MPRTLIHGQGHEPDVYLYDTVEELRQELGYPFVSGLFDDEANVIHATRESLAHEIAHFKDKKSGRYLNWQELKSPEERRRAQIRNELVAILYSWKKMAEPQFFHAFEQEILELFYYQIDQGFLPERAGQLSDLTFSDIQDFAELWLQNSSANLAKLESCLSHYLAFSDENQGKILSIIRG